MCGQRDIEVFNRQDGAAARHQLIAVGLSERVVDHRLKTGRYRLIHRNVYALGPLSMRGRLRAALLAGGDNAWLCHASALVPCRLRESVVTLAAAFQTTPGEEPQLRFHRLTLSPDEVTKRDGL